MVTLSCAIYVVHTGNMNVGTEMMGKTNVLSSGLHISEILPPNVVSGGQPKSAARKRQMRYVSILRANATPTSNNANAVIPIHNILAVSPNSCLAISTYRRCKLDFYPLSH